VSMVKVLPQMAKPTKFWGQEPTGHSTARTLMRPVRAEILMSRLPATVTTVVLFW